MPAAYRIEAQLETLRQKGLRHAVLSAFGCGAFLNPPSEVARIYSETLRKYADDLDVVVFAIFYPGYGEKDNFHAFAEALKNFEPWLYEESDVVSMQEESDVVSMQVEKKLPCAGRPRLAISASLQSD